MCSLIARQVDLFRSGRKYLELIINRRYDFCLFCFKLDTWKPKACPCYEKSQLKPKQQPV